ncbi:MAG: hypothetical protein EON60_02305 [Alphaproteobacteria bacterium]|nr:MAG: hypothetical protein EON60_02305 [Alphaproteobacteria bacterium]
MAPLSLQKRVVVINRLARRVWMPLMAGVAVLMMAAMPVAQAQEQFFTQSGGRGLQNAKTNARLSKVEGDVDILNVEMAKVQPHAKAQLGSCPDAGDKLRYTGTNWVCDRETDPTVQGFAKKALPTCTGGSILGVQGGEFACVQTGFVSDETDPTVQGFAKAPLPSCGTDQVLSVSGNQLGCANDQTGLTREVDPMVHDFARVDLVPALPQCSTNEMLTMNNGRLSCRVDAVGITVEVDPVTADFARKDISGYSLAACASGELLRAVTESGKVLLKCEAAADVIGNALALGDLSDVDTTGQVSGSILIYNGSGWVAGSEIDPTVPGWAKSAISACGPGQVITYDGTSLTCVNDAGGSAEPLLFSKLDDVNVSGVADGQFVKYDLTTQKWVPGSVQEFAQASLPTCSSGQVLTGDGTTLSCVDDAGGASDPIDLVELGDVRTGPSTNLSPNNNDFLRYNGGTSKWQAVHDKLSGVLTTGAWCYYNGTDVVCDRGAPQQCAAGTVMSWNSTSNAFECADATAALGLGTMAVQNANDVSITGGVINGTTIGMTTPDEGRFTNLRVTGNLYVSGSQSIDGVSFANGGLQATGTVTATTFVGDGSGLTGIEASNLQASGIVGSVQYKGAAGEISGSNALVWSSSSANLDVQGTVQVAGTGAEACGPSDRGKMRVVDLGAGDVRMQFCR